jgi:hypothetical protein
VRGSPASKRRDENVTRIEYPVRRRELFRHPADMPVGGTRIHLRTFQCNTQGGKKPSSKDMWDKLAIEMSACQA